MSGPGYCNKKLMLYDEACLHIQNNGSQLLSIFTQSSECYKCSLRWLFNVGAGTVRTTTIQTTYETILKFNLGSSSFGSNCQFQQHGHYNVSVSEDRLSSIENTVPPGDAYGPLKFELWALLVISILWCIGTCTSYYFNYLRQFFQPNLVTLELQNDLGTPSGSSEPSLLLHSERLTPLHTSRGTSRFKSLDVFRGITIVMMLFVNYGGGKYAIFEHAPWNGLTIADVVFPWFAWIMGCSLLLSLSSRYRVSHSRQELLSRLGLRSLALLAFGISYNSLGDNDLHTFRIPGVLQRLGLSFLIVGAVETLFVQVRLDRFTGKLSAVQDWLSGWIQWLFFLSLAIAHPVTLKLSQVPGCPLGYLGPGGFHENSSASLCTGGWSGYLDRHILTPPHLYQRPSSVKVYGRGTPFDPEGIFGLLTTLFTVFLGVHAARTYLSFKRPSDLILRWLILAIISGAIAGHLSGWSKEEGEIPLNKNLWSLSFCLATASLAFIAITLLYFIVDFKGWWSGAPFLQVGKNAIFLYLFSALTKNTFPWRWKPVNMTTHAESLIMDTWATFLWILIGVTLAKKNIIITI